MQTYTPKSIDTSSVKLPASLSGLLETLAENTHDVRATQRIKAGWTQGQKRDDERKQNPCLVPYHELSDSEKQYDRQTAREALKAVIALGGYEIHEAARTVKG